MGEKPKPHDRYDLPYGMWVCDDGTAYLFNRRYEPIWVKRPGRKATEADPKEWVKWRTQFWFWSDFTDIGNSKVLASQMRFIRDSFCQSHHDGPGPRI